MSNDESVFSFELNESLFFEKGQEVAEMRGISLDPEITIQTFNDYISIVGKIELRGEFEKIVSAEEEKITDFTDYQAKRYVEKVVDTVNNVATFSHRFPVEISIPSYRVSDINDITVNIEAFDYEIPDPSHLKLYSTIEIYGINSEIETPFAREANKELEEEALQEEEASLDETLAEQLNEMENREKEAQERETQKEDHELQKLEESREQDHESREQDHESREQDHESREQDHESQEQDHESQEQDHESQEQAELQDREETVEVGDSFQFEMKEKQQKESADAVELLNTDHPPALPVETDTVLEEGEEQEEADPDRWKYKETKSLAEFFNKLPSQESEEALQEITDTGTADTDIPSASLSASPSVDVEATELDEESSERVEGVTYLSDMFRESEERQYTKLRLCIVQDQDTIESIAERYHISALQLIKQNHLDEDYNIEEGQLLNIPIQKEK